MMSTPERLLATRRKVLASAGAGLMTAAMPAVAAVRPDRLSLRNLHTEETLDVVFRKGDRYDETALAALDYILRDWRRDEVLPLDRGLFDMMATIAARVGQPPSFEIISGYRSPETNEMLRSRGGGAAKRSLHMEGRAVDLRLEGVKLATLRDTALALGQGGVGYYPRSGFVHIDTGRVRSWGG